MLNTRKIIQFSVIVMFLAAVWLVSTVLMTKGDPEVARQAWPLIENGALLLDVRSAEEFAAEHIEGAINISYDQTDALIATIGPDKLRSVVVYCRSGNRSGKAQAALEARGYQQVFNATGLDALIATKP